jgi:hypothetical protein
MRSITSASVILAVDSNMQRSCQVEFSAEKGFLPVVFVDRQDPVGLSFSTDLVLVGCPGWSQRAGPARVRKCYKLGI